jgi:hypothetical protein
MKFADLTDTLFSFECESSPDKCDFWDYDFYAKNANDKTIRNLSKPEIVQLRENCKRILQATDNLPRRG